MDPPYDYAALPLANVRRKGALALMGASGGLQSFNAVNQMRVLGRWMRMITIPNQSSVAKTYEQFDDDGRMEPSSYYGGVVDVVEERVPR